MKKRFLSIILAASLCLSLSACAGKTKTEPENDTSEESTEDSYSYNISALLSKDNKMDEILLQGFSDALTDYIGDEGKKRTPGVGVAFKMPLTTDIKDIEIVPSFYSGDIVPGLKAAVLGDIWMSTADGVDPEIGVAGGVSYELAVGDSIKVTPKAGFRFANTNAGANLLKIFGKKNTDNGGYTDIAPADGTDEGLLNVKAGVDISGLIENTTFGAYYQSRNLRALKDSGKAGTFNVFAKISL